MESVIVSAQTDDVGVR